MANWQALGGKLTGTPAVARNADGRREVFAAGGDGVLWHIRQSAPGAGWGTDTPFDGQPPAAYPAATPQLDGRIALFAVQPDGNLRQWCQTTPNGGWAAPIMLSGALTSAPALGRNADGRLEVFTRDSGSGELYHLW